MQESILQWKINVNKLIKKKKKKKNDKTDPCWQIYVSFQDQTG